MSRFFKEIEFQRCVPPCSERDMNADFLSRLDMVREESGIPLVLSCAFRSVAWDKAKGRSGNSAHTRGVAVDIVCNSSATRYKIVTACIKCGINRIGIGKNFVHIDTDTSLPQGVIFDYY